MRLKQIRIKKFKRFTDLTVTSLPSTARLVVLAGPNGCGKSSFLDALYTWHKWTARQHRTWEADYHVKTGSPHRNRWTNDVEVEFHGDLPQEAKKVIYVRSAYRNDPDFQMQQLRRQGDPLNEIPFERMIDNDAAVRRNYERLASKGMEDLYEKADGTTTFDAYRTKHIGELREKLGRLFPNLELHSLGNPLEDGTFRFTKGKSEGFVFKNLSGGEKAAFDLILDLSVAKQTYDDTVFCIDEPESHMNARLQAELLSVMDELVPEGSQLVLATHSIGMMRRARDIEAEVPGSVVFLDFFDRDFDESEIITPAKADRVFWHRVYDVALDDLAALVAPRRVVICEGQPRVRGGMANHSQDARCYERMFEDEFPETRFVSVGNDRDVVGDREGLAEALRLLVGGLEVVRLVDLDDRSPNGVRELRRRGVRVLHKRNLESYLFQDELLRELAVRSGKEERAERLLAEKRRIVESRPGDALGDLKPASGQIYIACKRVLELSQCGNTVEEFMRDTMAPLVRRGLPAYDQLREVIFG